MTRTVAWRDNKVIAEDFPLKDISEHVEAGAVVWADLCAPQEAELKLIADELGLDDLAVEDAVSAHERAKLDRYPSYLFLNAYALAFCDGEIETSEVSAFVTDHAMVTVRADEKFDIAELQRRWDPEMTEHGVAYLLHGLLDLLVDQHFAAIQQLDDEVENLEDLLFADGFSDQTVQKRAFQLRRSLVLLRRIVLPMREIVNTLLRRDLRIVPEALGPYYQDVYDHALRATEWTEGLRDLVANVMDTRIALQGNRMNEVMKQVTSWAAIIAVPTAVTGFYGMNVPYPGFDRPIGFWTSVVVVIISSVSLFTVFKKRDWL